MICWNGFCVSTQCDGVNHVDGTGYTWAQVQGDVYCPVHDRNHSLFASCPYTDLLGIRAENERFRRFQASGMTAAEFTAAEAAGAL